MSLLCSVPAAHGEAADLQDIAARQLPGLGAWHLLCLLWLLAAGRPWAAACGQEQRCCRQLLGGAENPRHRDFPLCREGQQGPAAGLDAHRPDPAPAKPRLPQAQPSPHRVPGLPFLPSPAAGVLSLPLFLAWLLQPLPPGTQRHPCCHPCCPRCCPQLPRPRTTSLQRSGGRCSWGCLSLPSPRLPGLSPRCLHLPRASVSPS